MIDVSVPTWEYKIVLASADGTISTDHLRHTTPLEELLDQLTAQGWQVVGRSETEGPQGEDVTYTLRRPAGGE